jgi:hypothetical protein
LAQFPVSFGEDANGNLYIAYIGSGEVFRIGTTIIPEPATAATGSMAAALALLTFRRRRRRCRLNSTCAGH